MKPGVQLHQLVDEREKPARDKVAFIAAERTAGSGSVTTRVPPSSVVRR